MMVEKIVTLEELIKLLDLKKDTVLTINYNEWYHNHPLGKLEFECKITMKQSKELIKKLGLK